MQYWCTGGYTRDHQHPWHDLMIVIQMCCSELLFSTSLLTTFVAHTRVIPCLYSLWQLLGFLLLWVVLREKRRRIGVSLEDGVLGCRWHIGLYLLLRQGVRTTAASNQSSQKEWENPILSRKGLSQTEHSDSFIRKEPWGVLHCPKTRSLSLMYVEGY